MATGREERAPWQWLLDDLLKRPGLVVGEGGKEGAGRSHCWASSLPLSFHSTLVCYSQAIVGPGAEGGLLRAHIPTTHLNPVLKEHSSKNHPEHSFCYYDVCWKEAGLDMLHKRKIFAVKGALVIFCPFLL